MNRRNRYGGAAVVGAAASLGLVVGLSGGQPEGLPCAQPDTNCQLPDQGGHGEDGVVGATSDANPDAGFGVVENFFSDAGGTVNSVCWWGFYLDFDIPADCSDVAPPDAFRVTYFNNVEGFPATPGSVKAGPFVQGVDLTVTSSPTGNVIPSGAGDLVEFEYSATHPDVVIDPGECCWIAVQNDTTGSTCFWLWSTAPSASEDPPGIGDNNSYQFGADPPINDFDLAFCVNLALGDPSTCDTPINPGCKGATNDCRTEASPDPGCADPECCTIVCQSLPFCCTDAWVQQCVDAAEAICIATFPQNTLTSPDGTWSAVIDDIGQVENLFPPDQPDLDNIFETLLYEASTGSDGLSRRVEDNYVLIEAVVDEGGSHSLARLAESDGPLTVILENFLIDGPEGGVKVKVTCENGGDASTDCKVFYYCDFDISQDFSDDEAAVISGPDGVHAIEQIDNKGDAGPKPLWFGGCPAYASWEIDTFADLRSALDGGVMELAGADGTVPGSDDHTAALSSGTATLGPGESVTVFYGLGAASFTALPECEPPAGCPWDCDGSNDGTVGIVDFLAVLAQWGKPGPCDFDGGGVGITDFLKLLANWGPCS